MVDLRIALRISLRVDGAAVRGIARSGRGFLCSVLHIQPGKDRAANEQKHAEKEKDAHSRAGRITDDIDGQYHKSEESGNEGCYHSRDLLEQQRDSQRSYREHCEEVGRQRKAVEVTVACGLDGIEDLMYQQQTCRDYKKDRRSLDLAKKQEQPGEQRQYPQRYRKEIDEKTHGIAQRSEQIPYGDEKRIRASDHNKDAGEKSENLVFLFHVNTSFHNDAQYRTLFK